VSQANVISFPIDRVVRTPVPLSTKKQIIRSQKQHINRIIEENATNMVSRLAMAGVDISTDDFQRNYAFTIECLRSTLYESLGIHHPLQSPMKEIIHTIEDFATKKD
jgi:hypothetical protein